MNIALLHYAAPPIVGGVETVLAKQANLISQDGHAVKIITGRGKPWSDQIPMDLIPLLDSRHPEILLCKSFLDKGVIPDNYDDLVQEIEDLLSEHLLNIQYLIAHNVASLHKNLPLTTALHHIAKSNNPTKIILWHHDFAWNAQRYATELYDRYPWNLLKQTWPNTKQVVVSEARKNELVSLQKANPDDIEVIPAGVNQNTLLNLQPYTQSLIKTYHLNNKSPILLTPVRLTRRKNLELAIHTLSELKSILPNACLLITGPLGAHNPANIEYLHQLQQIRKEHKLEDSCFFLAENKPDGLTEVEIGDLYKISDILLITSTEEGFGIPIIEAGLTGLIIFCTNLAPLKALAGEYANYFSVTTPPQKIANHISKTLETNTIYQLRQQIKANYTWENIYKKKIFPLFGEL